MDPKRMEDLHKRKATYDADSNSIMFGGLSLYHTAIDTAVHGAGIDHLVKELVADESKPPAFAIGIKLKTLPPEGFSDDDIAKLAHALALLDSVLTKPKKPPPARGIG